MASVSLAGLSTDEYQRHVVRLLTAEVYPWYGVAQFSAVVSVEVAALWAVLRPQSYAASWVRAVCAVLLFVPVTLYFGLGLMHAPPYQAAHFLWSVCVSAALLVTLVVSAAAAFSRRRGERDAELRAPAPE